MCVLNHAKKDFAMKNAPKIARKTLHLSLCAFTLCISANATNAQNTQATNEALETQDIDSSTSHSHDTHSQNSSHDLDSSSHHTHNDSSRQKHHHDSTDSSHSHDSHPSHTHFTSGYNYLHTYEPHIHPQGRTLDFASLSAKIGIFGKSSALADKKMNANGDNYSMLYSNILLQSAPFANSATALSGFNLGLGVVAYVPFYNDKKSGLKYINSNFVANSAYLGYTKDFSKVGVEFRAGRFDTDLEWVGHSLQGAFARVTLPFGAHTPHSAQIYGIWLDEQAHIMREISTNFDFYKHLYNKENLYAGGVNLSFGLAQDARLHFEPYAYYLSNFFGVYGAKFVLDLGFGGDLHQNSAGTKWRSKTTAHSAFLYSNYARIRAGHNHAMGHNHNEHSHSGGHSGHRHLGTSERGDTYFVLLEQEFGYKDLVYFGIGFQHIGAYVFEIANLGGTSRFEAHEGAGFGVMRPGAVHAGSQITYAYDARTNTYYGFVGARFGKQKRFALEAMGRDSRNSANTKAQSAFSLGLKYEFPYGFEIGGIGVFMLDKHQHGSGHSQKEMIVNRSFGKAYVQWSF